MTGSTVGQVLGQVRQLQSAPRFIWGEVVSVSGTSAVVQLQPGGQTPCEIPKGQSPATGDRVMVLVAPIGNIVLAVMAPLAVQEGTTP
ncbi:hypothetical protein ACIRJS_16550 [Streptomyces sp. NPDC102340]|uniref:hypothetical protein n=1 Tax=unclassified Streptomyces TaxID=2593676 RepID=UPI00381173F8